MTRWRNLAAVAVLGCVVVAAGGCEVGGRASAPGEESADGISSSGWYDGRGNAAPARRTRRNDDDDFEMLERMGPDEELWVLVRPAPRRVADVPRCGSLLAAREDDVPVPIPLEKTAVSAEVAGSIATVDVHQRFRNPYSDKIEAVYVFPLPHDAAVAGFVMTVGERRIRGIVRDREEAEELYYEARARGHVASLLTQERPNVFTQRVANIEPRRSIEVDIRYFNELSYRDGAFEFVFPMVVGPRYNPAGASDPIRPTGRYETTGRGTETTYLAPGEDGGHRIDLTVDVEAGVGIEEIWSPSHSIDVDRRGATRAVVKLGRHDRVPDADFVLRYRVAGGAPKAGLVTHRDERGGFFTLMLVPPRDVIPRDRTPVELVFVLDASGSMNGAPLALAKDAAARALQRLEPDDTFRIIRFSDSSTSFSRNALPATRDNVRRGLRHLRELGSGGGTEMLTGVRAALNRRPDPGRRRIVSFMTDGFIGNESDIFRAVSRDIRDARLFSFGVGSSVNRHLLEGMARLGRGAVAYVGLDDGAAREADRFYERMRHAVMRDIRIDWGGARVEGVHPGRIPDLVVGRPVTLVGRFRGAAPSRVIVRGRVAHRTREIVVADEALERAHRGLPRIWARARIADLEYRHSWSREDELAEEIRSVALEFGLVSSLTAFVAVDGSRRTDGEWGTTVPVPTPMPRGVKYDTTVRDRGN